MKYSLKTALLAITLVSCLLGLGIWLFSWSRLEVAGAELLEAQDIILGEESDFNFVNGLTVKIVGHIEGEATIEFPWDYTSFVVGPGDVSILEGHDFYENTAVLKYTPKHVTDGHITIKYLFW